MRQSIKTFHGTEFKELVGSVPRADHAEWFGVSIDTLKRWLSGASPVPLAALKLARMRWRGDLSELFGRGWCELSVSEAGLQLPGWRRPFAAGELRSTFMRLQQLELIRLENARLRQERGAAWQAQEEAENAAAWYRRQLRLESHLGAMLHRIEA